MEGLALEFKNHIDQLVTSLQGSELLANFIEEESIDVYKQMVEAYEPHLEELYQHVANNHPMQLIDLENSLLNEGLEGLFLPRVLGYSVLRGEIDANYKYKRPQDHFKNILVVVCNSANFDFIKQRIGQTIQLGFALSSDIWLTNLVDSITNKKVKYFLQSQKLDKYRDLNARKVLYNNYSNQMKSQVYFTADFPETVSDLKVLGTSLMRFLKIRAHRKFNNVDVLPYLERFLKNEKLQDEKEYLEVLMISGMYYDLNDDTKKYVTGVLDKLRKNNSNFETFYFDLLQNLYRSEIEVTPAADKKMSSIINKSIKDDISAYYALMDTIHTKGYVHEDTINSVKEYYDRHQGLSMQNECLRDAIFGYCESFLNNLDADSYTDFFEMYKVFISYINTFYNQKYNQNIKQASLRYIHKLLLQYTDKRGKDYQDIKRFVSSTFLDLGFMTEKELTELFKTVRK